MTLLTTPTTWAYSMYIAFLFWHSDSSVWIEGVQTYMKYLYIKIDIVMWCLYFLLVTFSFHWYFDRIAVQQPLTTLKHIKFS